MTLRDILAQAIDDRYPRLDDPDETLTPGDADAVIASAPWRLLLDFAHEYAAFLTVVHTNGAGWMARLDEAKPRLDAAWQAILDNPDLAQEIANR